MRLNAGKFAEAEALYRESLEGYKRAFGDDHPTTLDCLQRYARSVYKQDGREHDAMVLVSIIGVFGMSWHHFGGRVLLYYDIK